MDTDEKMIETLGRVRPLRILIFPAVINVPDGTSGKNHDGTEEKPLWFANEPAVAGKARSVAAGRGPDVRSLGYSSITPPASESLRGT